MTHRRTALAALVTLAACQGGPAPELAVPSAAAFAVVLPSTARLAVRAPHVVEWPAEVGLRGRRFERRLRGEGVTQFVSATFDARALGWFRCDGRAAVPVQYTLTMRFPPDGVSAGAVTLYARAAEAPCPAALARYQADAARMLDEVFRLAHWRVLDPPAIATQ